MQNPQLIKAYKKTIKTIESCNTEEQLKVASKMVKNFKKMYKQVGYPKALSYSLDRVLKRKKL
jgi:DNA-binding XRE family transcriptional regulator|tara:strand:+ start:95 stop:283 length:189 start_codon:yes stop_codon:yes gene_type:complete